MDDLALQVGEVDNVVVDDADGTDPGGGQIEQQRRAEAAGTDHQDLRAEKARLAFAADFLQQDVTGITLNLFFAEVHGISQSPSKSTVEI